MSTPPKGWAKIPLAEAGSWSSGGTPSRSNPEFFGGEVPWIKSGDLPDGPITKTSEQITRSGLAGSAAKLLPSGTLSIALYGATIGKLGILTFEAATNQACANVVPNLSLIDRRYLFYSLLSARKSLIELGQGGAQPNISQEIVRSYTIPLAPLAEQRRIADKLGALLARVDASSQRLDKIPKLLARLRQSVLAAACSGRLTEDWRASGFEDSERRCQAAIDGAAMPRATETTEAFPTADEFPIPDPWRWVSAKNVCSKITDGEHIQPPYEPVGFPMLSAKHVREGFVRLEGAGLISPTAFEAAVARCNPEKGDILVVSVGATTGRSAIVHNCAPFALVRSVLLLKPTINSKYLLRCLQGPWHFRWMTQASGASAQPHLYIKDMKRLPVPLPPDKETEEIVRRVDQLFAFADRLEARIESARKRVNALTQSILAKAFRGELVPSEAELAEAEGRTFESGADLLVRIRAKRDATATPTASRKRTSRTGRGRGDER